MNVDIEEAEPLSHELGSGWKAIAEDIREGLFVGEVIRSATGIITDYVIIYANPSFARMTGVPLEVAIGSRLTALFPLAGDAPLQICRRVVSTGISEEFDMPFDDPVGWYEGRVRRLSENRFTVVFQNTTKHHSAELALAAAEDRYRRLFDAIDEGFCVIEMIFDDDQPVDYRFLEANPAFERHTGLVDPVGRTAREMVDGLEAHWFQTYGAVARDRRAVRMTLPAPSMGQRTFDIFAFPVAEELPNQVGILFIDVSERVAMDEQRSFLNRELGHRLKNTLAVVQSVVSQTLRSAPDIESARQSLSSRIQALALAHEVVLKGEQEGGQICDIIRAAVDIHDPECRVDIDGEPMVVHPAAALSLSMAMNELATNATKYGALSTAAGRVRVSWELTRLAHGTRLCLSWIESGGPPVRQPDRQGFGSRLIARGISGAADGSVVMDFPVEGLECRITAVLPYVTPQVATGDSAEAR